MEDYSFLYFNATKMNQLKVEDSEIKPYPRCLGTVQKNLAANNMKKKEKNY